MPPPEIATLGIDVTELFLEDAPADAPDGDGLVWKTVCRTGQWKLSPLPGGKPLVIDKALFDDVKRAFDDGAWEHVTVPLSHKDRVDENTGFVRALKVEPDAKRQGQWVLRAGMKFTDPAIREKVTNGSIANTSVGIALTGHKRTSDGKFFRRVLKHVALTNQPWLDGLEPFGGEMAASLDGPAVYELEDVDPEDDVTLFFDLDGVEEAYQEAMLFAAWDPAEHPRWPKGTPKVGGEFMSIGSVIKRITAEGGKTADVSFLGKGSDHITKVVASDASTDKNQIAHFEVTLDNGAKHTFDVTHTGPRDGALIQGALRQIDHATSGGVKTYGIGDVRAGQARPHIDPVLEHVLEQAEKDPRLKPPIPAGKVAKKLLSRVVPGMRPLGGKGAPDGYHGNTMQMFTLGGEIDPSNGEVVGRDVVWSPERRAFHEEVINYFLNNPLNRTPGKQDPNAKPIALFTAGGAAVGKSTALEQHPEIAPPGAVKIDPDEIKGWIPEYRDAVSARDRYAGTLAHEESSYLAKEITKRALAQGLNVVIDGAGDSPPNKFLGKLEQAAAPSEGAPDGYDVHLVLVDAPTEVCAARSVLRGQKTGRFMPLEMLRSQHNSVAARHEEWRSSPAVKSWHMYSTATPGKSTLVAEGGDGKFTVHDQAEYDRSLAKAGRRGSDRGIETVANTTEPTPMRRKSDQARRDAVARRRSAAAVAGADYEAARARGEMIAPPDKAPGEGSGPFVLVQGQHERRFASQRQATAVGDVHGGKLYRENADGKRLFVKATVAKSLRGRSPDARGEVQRVADRQLLQDVRTLARQAVKAVSPPQDDVAREFIQAMQDAMDATRPEQPDVSAPGAEALRRTLRKISGGGRPTSGDVQTVRSVLNPSMPNIVRSLPTGRARTTANDYLNEEVNYGGERMTVAAVIRSLRSAGNSQAIIDRTVQGLLRGQPNRQLRFPGIAASITITDPSPELILGVWDSALHPRGGKGRFIRKLLDAAGNTAVREVGESGHSLHVVLHSGHTLHVEPVSGSRVRVIHTFNGSHVRTSVHAISDLVTAHPALRGLTGLIRSKARKVAGGHQVTRRVPGSRGRRGLKDLVHYGTEREMAASHEGGDKMGEENEDGTVETITLSQEQFNEAVRAAVEEQREQDRLELSRSRGEVRELRVERRIQALQEKGHAPALLKVVEQIMLADESDEPVLALAQDDGTERTLTPTMIVEELLAAIPETALTASQPGVPGRAEGDGGEHPEDADAFQKRMDETWSAMQEGKHLAV